LVDIGLLRRLETCPSALPNIYDKKVRMLGKAINPKQTARGCRRFECDTFEPVVREI
jgi:hypothetical protein